jgi:hypothetical protein
VTSREKIASYGLLRLCRLLCGKLPAFWQAAEHKSLIVTSSLSLLAGKAEPFRTAGGNAAISSHLLISDE